MLSLSAVAAAASHQPLNWSDLHLSPIALPLGIIQIKWYSLAYLAGIILAYWHLSRMIRQPAAPMAQRHADDLFFYGTLGVIGGGRLGYALFYTGGNTGQPSLFTHFTPGQTVSWDLLRLWDGGMSFHGGLIGVLLAIAYVSWRGRLSFLRTCDYISVCVPFGLFFGRLANFVNGELWGRVTTADIPWAMVFPGAGPDPRHPSQLYEAGLEGIVLGTILLLLFWKTRARWRPGLLVGIFALGYGVSRFIVEYFREPDAQLEAFAHETGLSMGQWLSVPLILVGLFFAVRALIKPRLTSGAPAVAAAD